MGFLIYSKLQLASLRFNPQCNLTLTLPFAARDLVIAQVFCRR